MLQALELALRILLLLGSTRKMPSGIAHPLLFFTNDARFAVRFHDYSSHRMHRQYPKLYKRVTPNETDGDKKNRRPISV